MVAKIEKHIYARRLSSTMNKATMKRLTLRDITDTAGFKEAFRRMARYTQRLEKEAEITCKFPVYHTAEQLYSLTYGSRDEIRNCEPSYFITKDGTLRRGESLASTYQFDSCAFQVHTHPSTPREALRYLRFSEADIEADTEHLQCMAGELNECNSVVTFPKNNLARCLVWQPNKSAVYQCTDQADKIASKLDDCAQSINPTKDVVTCLREYGHADIIDFVKNGSTWDSKADHLSRLEKFVIRED